MFYFSLWTWYGVGLMAIYVMLVWFGFAKRKTHRAKSGEKKAPAVLERSQISEKARSLSQESKKHPTKDERCEDVASLRARSREDTSGLRKRFQDVAGDENVVVEEVVEALQCIPDLESQNFDLEADKSVEKTAELATPTTVVLERFSSQQAAKIIENGLQSISERFAPVQSRESNSEQSRSDCKLEWEEQETSMRGVSAFAEELVKATMGDAFQHFKVATADRFARNLTSQVLVEAFAEIREGNYGSTEHKNISTVQLLNSFIPADGDNISTYQNIEIFAQDFCENLLNEGMDAVVIKEADIAKVKKYSDNFVSRVVADGVLAAGTPKPLGAKENKPDLSPSSPISEHAQHLTNQLCQMAYQEVALSTSLQTSVTGVVENLVNGAIFEAVSKVKETSGSTEHRPPKELRDETVKLNSQLQNEQNTKVAAVVAEGVVTEAMEEVALLSHSESENDVKTGDQVNGHGEVSEPAISIANGVQTECSTDPQETVVRRAPNRSKQPEGVCEEHENGSKHSGFWRQSLLLDLEEDVDYDDNSSEASCEKALDEAIKQSGALPTDHDSSDEDSEEFIDSSEDEIIDHAEEAKLGAVGGARGPATRPAPKWDADEDFDEMESFEPEVAVDGLCMSRPHKHKKKSLPRARVQSG